MPSIVIWALPGFLGLPSDWDVLQLPCTESSTTVRVKAINIMQFNILSLGDWASQFNSLVHAQCIDQNYTQKNLLLGYSLGGRLALHALLDMPKLWDGAIIISSHPGLSNESEQAARIKSDEHWAQRFLTESWSSLMDDWNNQKIFAGAPFSFQRHEKNYQRSQLADLLKYCSLGKQKDLRSQIAELCQPILWITGEDDKHCSAIARTIKFNNMLSNIIKMPQAGHRAPWQQPQLFCDILNKWLINSPYA